MKYFFLTVNEHKDPSGELTEQIRTYLRARGAVCVVKSVKDPAPGPETDCILTLGGDGTLLRAIRKYNDLEKPFLGINTGTLGYLTEGERDDIPQILDRLLEDAFSCERRMMLSGYVYRDGQFLARHRALNDITVARTASLKALLFRVYVNDRFLSEFRADGLIAASPTGSTAYSYSCGGPIVEPSAQLFVITPVAPHAMNRQSLILPASDRIVFEVGSLANQELDGIRQIVSFDGDKSLELLPGDRVEITKAPHAVKLLHLNDRNFLDVLRVKLAR